MVKSQKQANFLHALQGDKSKSGGPITPAQLMMPPTAGATPMTKPLMPAAPGPNPMIKPPMTPPPHVPQAAAPKLMPPKAPMNPVAAPSLPATGNLPKFGKMRNSLKGSPFNKSNKA